MYSAYEYKALYRLHTERKNEEEVIEEVKNMVSSFAVFYGTGVYKGEEEETMVIECYTQDTQHNDAVFKTLRDSIRMMNNQDEVLLTKTFTWRVL